MIKIKLECGREVTVEGFEFGYTYGGLLYGTPDESMNEGIFKRTEYSSTWGLRKVLNIKPEKSEFESRLKPCHYSVWLSSSEPVNPESHGSELVVVWFADLPNGKTVEDIIKDGIKSIDWNKNAQDFEY